MKKSTDFPEWAPSALIEYYVRASAISASTCEFDPGDPESYIERIQNQYSGKLSAENIEDIRQRLYRNSFVSLPRAEQVLLLESLLTNPDMKEAWASIKSRANCETDFVRFVQACEDGITGWRGDKKRTKKEKEARLMEIQDAAKILQSLLDDSPEFDFYSITKLIHDNQLDGALSAMDADLVNDVRYFRSIISDIVPTIRLVLTDIHDRAGKHVSEAVIVGKPGSERAQIQYFCRKLSLYCIDTYSSPLHLTVARTASTVFGVALDEDYVKKIAKRQ